MWDRRARLVEVHDGDTVIMELDQGWYDKKTVHVRLFGVYAPELKDPGGPECQEYAQSWFNTYIKPSVTWGFVVVSMTLKSEEHELTTLSRTVGTIMTLDGVNHLNADVVKYIKDNSFGPGIT